jgi:hypothetical protein
VTLRTALAAAALATGLAVPVAIAAPSPSPVARDILAASALEAQWGRCPTARPAAVLLAIARRPARAPVAAARAKGALGAWRAVAAACAQPVPQPAVSR